VKNATIARINYYFFFCIPKFRIMNVDVKSLGMALGTLKGVFPKVIGAQLKRVGITYSFDQMVVLIIVRFCNKAQTVQQDIAEHMGKDKSVILRMIDLLEEDGLLHRTTDVHDRRRNIISLTDKGFEYTNRFIELEKEVSRDLLEGLSDSEIASFYKVIMHVEKKSKEV
jgi:DNA-binding MarR family transcriptional regulator